MIPAVGWGDASAFSLPLEALASSPVLISVPLECRPSGGAWGGPLDKPVEARPNQFGTWLPSFRPGCLPDAPWAGAYGQRAALGTPPARRYWPRTAFHWPAPVLWDAWAVLLCKLTASVGFSSLRTTGLGSFYLPLSACRWPPHVCSTLTILLGGPTRVPLTASATYS